MIFVDEIVAVKHVYPSPGSIASDNSHSLSRRKIDNVFPPSSLVRKHLIARPSAREDLEVNKMDMNWMRKATSSIRQNPNLVSASFWSCEDTVLDIGESHTVDNPSVVDALKGKVLGGFFGGDGWDLAETLGYVAIVARVGDCVANYEAHDHVGGGEIRIFTWTVAVSHGKVLAGLIGEVDDDFVALTFGQCEIFGVYWMGKKA
jgi:hypothetical protein